MIAINMIGGRALFFGKKSSFTEYLLPRVIGRGHFSGDFSEASTLPVISPSVNKLSTIPPLTPVLQEKLLGKAPLRLITSRTKIENWYEETLECGHSYTAYQNFLWDEGGHLVNLEPTAKRRRCQPCKALELSQKKPAQSVRLGRKEKSA